MEEKLQRRWHVGKDMKEKVRRRRDRRGNVGKKVQSRA